MKTQSRKQRLGARALCRQAGLQESGGRTQLGPGPPPQSTDQMGPITLVEGDGAAQGEVFKDNFSSWELEGVGRFTPYSILVKLGFLPMCGLLGFRKDSYSPPCPLHHHPLPA